MKIAVFSDTHGPIENIRIGLEKLLPVDYLLFAGDGIKQLVDSNITQQVKVMAVKGNRDAGIMYPEEKIIEAAGKKIFLTHGNNYGVNWGLDNLYYKAKEIKADIVIFGHTHCRYAKKEDDILFFNPGSATSPRDEFPPAYGLLTIKDGEITYKHYDLS